MLCSRCYVLGREFCIVSSSFGLFSCLARTDWWKPLRLCGWTPKFLLRDLSLGSSQLGTETVPLRLSMDAMRLARSLLTQNIIWLKDKNKVSHWPRLNAHSFPPSLPPYVCTQPCSSDCVYCWRDLLQKSRCFWLCAQCRFRNPCAKCILNRCLMRFWSATCNTEHRLCVLFSWSVLKEAPLMAKPVAVQSAVLITPPCSVFISLLQGCSSPTILQGI